MVMLTGCGTAKFSNLKNGDLLFVEAKKENLSGAISRVTKNNEAISFDHLALVELSGNKIFVLESATKYGSVKITLDTFIKNNGFSRIVIYRLKNSDKEIIDDAILNANKMLGKPYNFSYILNENSYYCSDFIERSFRTHNIFKLEPMTFVNPATGQTDDYWKSFYSNLKVDVPEGLPGCNPNGLAKSEKLEKIGLLKNNN